MPRYDFKCNACQHRFTATVSIKDRHNVKCPNCNKGTVAQIFTSVNILGGGANDCQTPRNSPFT